MSKRKSTKFVGVQARESESRRFRGRPDVCYTIDYKDASGKRIRKDVGWLSEGFSAAYAAELRRELIHGSKVGALDVPMPEKAMPLGEAWELYRKDWLVPQKKDLKPCISLINGPLKDLKDLPLDRIDARVLDGVMAEMAGCGYAPQTIRHAIALVRRIMRTMAKWRLYAGPMPFEAITLPKLNNQRERFLTPQEARALLTEIKRRSHTCWTMALISLHCGLRFGEIARLRWEDVRFESRTLYIPDSKSGHARHAVMTDEVIEALKLMSSAKMGSLIFTTRSGEQIKETPSSFERSVDALELNGKKGESEITDRRKRVVFHTLRHTYASWLGKSGMNQATIADRLGHRSFEMSRRYTHLMDETRRETAEAISSVFHSPLPGQNQK